MWRLDTPRMFTFEFHFGMLSSKKDSGGVSRVPIGGQWLYESGDLEGKEIQTRGRETEIPLVPQAHRRYEEKGVWAGDYPVGVDGLSDGALAVAGVGVVEVVKTPADYEAGVALVEVVRAPVVQE